MNEAEELFADYAAYWLETLHVRQLKKEHPYFKDLKPNAVRLELMAAMASWCRKREIDPRLWLLSLFRSRNWRFAPKLGVGSLMSEHMIPVYRKIKTQKGVRVRCGNE